MTGPSRFDRQDDREWEAAIPHPETRELVGQLIEAAATAGAVIMEVFHDGFEIETKSDDSPVTIADQKAEAVILERLKTLAPDIPVVAEESASAGIIPDVSRGAFFCVDPLDGTKEFINRRDSFTVNIALIEDRVPVLGVVYAPALDRMYAGYAGSGGIPGAATIIDNVSSGNRTERSISTRPADPAHLDIVASKSHINPETESYLSHYPDAGLVNVGSSLKFCLLAEGKADLYPRFGPTMEWDTAAGQAVLTAAGGDVLTTDGAPFLYSKPLFRNGFFIARGDRNFQPVLVAAAS